MSVEKWDCPTCTLVNAGDAVVCAACDNPSPFRSGSCASASLQLNASKLDALSVAVEQIWNEPTLKVLFTLVSNAIEHPDVPKFRGPVRKRNERIQALILDVPGAADVLRESGFQDDEECFVLGDCPDRSLLLRSRELLHAQEKLVAGTRLVHGAGEGGGGTAAARSAVSTADPSTTVSSAVAVRGRTRIDPTACNVDVPEAPSRFPRVKRRRPMFDENVLREVQADQQLNRDLRGNGFASCDGASGVASARVSTIVQSQEKPQHGGEIRLRVRLPFGGQLDIQVSRDMSVGGLWRLLLERTGVPIQHQGIRFGFPPRVLSAPGRSSDIAAQLLSDVGFHDGEVVHLENLHDLFLGKLESGMLTMAALIEALPPEDDSEEGLGTLFQEALIVLGIDLNEMNFWQAVEARMKPLLVGADIDTAQKEQLRAGLFLIQRIFRNHGLHERVSLVLRCQPGFDNANLHGMVTFDVDRDDMLGSVATQVLSLRKHELLAGVHIVFKGERGEDAGGPRRDFFSEFASRLSDAEPTLWRLTGRGSLQPVACVVATASRHRHHSGLSAAELYRACGRIFGMAVPNACKLGRPLASSFVRLLVGDPPRSLEELQAALNAEAGEGEPDFRGSRMLLDRPLSESGLAGVLTLTRTITGLPEEAEIEMVPSGSQIEVTDENKAEWLEKLLRHKLVTDAEMAADAFRQGIVDVFGGCEDTCPLLCLLDVDDLIELWCGHGVEQKDLARWRAVSQVSPAVALQAGWFWEVLAEEFDDELRGKVLQFATGSSRIGREGLTSFSIEPADGGDDRLPTAMTCGNMLQMPRYSNRLILAQQLRTAAENGGSFQLT